MDVVRAVKQLRNQVEKEYRERTPRSRALHEEAQRYLPSGDTRFGTTFAPYPTYIDYAQGSFLHDVDGNVILDFDNNATALIHGHARPEVVRAIQDQAARGTAWRAPNQHQVRLAEILSKRMPSMERLRFCNSGTEANMQAIKLARAFTGKDKILMLDGAYHGSYDGTEISSHGPTNRGVPRNEVDNVCVATFDDESSVERVIIANRRELAAVIVTPVFTGGSRLSLPSLGYLEFLREITRAYGMLLIFDEVITFRIGPGGAQEYFGVAPDLTALGKIIGGGLPVGGFGGRAEIMELLVKPTPPAVLLAGTFNGNPMTMTAGVATLELMTRDEYDRLAGLGSLLQTKLEEISRGLELDFEVSRVASLLSVGIPGIGLIGSEKETSEREMDDVESELLSLLQLALLCRGAKGSGIFAISTAMTESEIHSLAKSLEDVLCQFRPIIDAVATNRIGR